MRVLERLYYLNVIITPSLLFLETFTPPDFLQRKILIPYLYLLCASLLLHFFLLSVINVTKQTQTNRYLFWAAVSTSLLTIVMYVAEKYLYPNVVFSSVFLHPEYFRFFSLYYLLASLLMLFAGARYKPHRMAWIFPFYFSLILFSLYFSFEPFFLHLGLEDGIIESLTCVFFACATGLAIHLSAHFFSKKKAAGIIFLALAVGCFFVAGEEISWGQRLLNLTSPDYFMEQNVQKELTVHNLHTYQGKMKFGYIIIGALGTLVPFIPATSWPQQLRMLRPPKHISVYFLPMLIYGCLVLLIGPLYYKTWEESMELGASAGIFIYLVTLFGRWKKPQLQPAKITNRRVRRT